MPNNVDRHPAHLGEMRREAECGHEAQSGDKFIIFMRKICRKPGHIRCGQDETGTISKRYIATTPTTE